MSDGRRTGEVILKLEGISLSFGGVRALTDISFDVREHEIRAIIGPNGAGKSSMLNVINGVYRPQQGRITFRGKVRRDMDPHAAAKAGIARTFQNIALFKGMSVLDNIMAGRNLKMRASLIEQALYLGRNRREELAHREKVERIIDFLQIEHVRSVSWIMGRAYAFAPSCLAQSPQIGMSDETARASAKVISGGPLCFGCRTGCDSRRSDHAAADR